MVRAARRGPRPRRRRGRARRRGERRSRRDRRHLLCDGDDELRRVARSDVYRSRSLGRPRAFRKSGLGGSHHLNRPIVRRGRRGQALHRVNEVEASVGRDLRVGRFDEVEHALPGSSADGAVANSQYMSLPDRLTNSVVSPSSCASLRSRSALMMSRHMVPVKDCRRAQQK